MKKLVFITIILATSSYVYGQEYRVGAASGTLEIAEVNRVIIEGHSGSEIVFSSENPASNRDERAEGLRAISSLGLEDNSGIGLSVIKEGQNIMVRQLKKTEGPKVKILVPRGVKVSYRHSSPYGSELEVRNFQGEVEVNTTHNVVKLVNAQGPLTVKTVHGDIDASFAQSPSSRISLESVHGHVDVALPTAAKANLTLSSQWGEMLVDPDLRIELNKSGELVNYSDKIGEKA